MGLIKNLLITLLISSIITTVIFNWVINDVPGVYPVFDDIQGIHNIEVDLVGKDININVHLEKPMSCAEVKKILQLEPVDVGAKTYVPNCQKLSKKHIRIIYSLTTQA